MKCHHSWTTRKAAAGIKAGPGEGEKKRTRKKRAGRTTTWRNWHAAGLRFCLIKESFYPPERFILSDGLFLFEANYLSCP